MSAEALHQMGRERIAAWLKSVDVVAYPLLDLLAGAWADGVRSGAQAVKRGEEPRVRQDG